MKEGGEGVPAASSREDRGSVLAKPLAAAPSAYLDRSGERAQTVEALAATCSKRVPVRA